VRLPRCLNAGESCSAGGCKASRVQREARSTFLPHSPLAPPPCTPVCGAPSSDYVPGLASLRRTIHSEAPRRALIMFTPSFCPPSPLAHASSWCSGECVVPFFSGERATGWREKATGVVCGLTRGTSRCELLIFRDWLPKRPYTCVNKDAHLQATHPASFERRFLNYSLSIR